MIETTSHFHGATLPWDCAPEAHFGADFYPLNLERIAVACSSGFPLPDSSGLLPARPTHALHTCYVCLLFEFVPLNPERIVVACSSGFPLPDSSGLMPARSTHALQTCYVCLLFEFYPLNPECIAVACSSCFPLPVWF